MTPDHDPERELADQLDACVTRSGGIDLRDPELLRRAASALRRLAAQDQKPPPDDELIERLQSCVNGLEDVETLPKPYDLYFAIKNDGQGTGWTYSCAGIGVTDLRAILDRLISPPPAAGVIEALEIIAGERPPFDNLMGYADLARAALKALRHNAPPDSGAGKSEPPVNFRQLTSDEQNGLIEALLDSGPVVGSLPDHGGADAGVIDHVAKSIWEAQHSRIKDPGPVSASLKWRSKTVPDVFWDGYVQDAKAALSALSHQPAPVAANASAEADHNPEDSAYWNRRAELGNASAEARLRENQGELYLRRDEVRKILIEQPEENLDVTEGVLADIDDLTAITRLEIRYPAVVKDFLWTVIRAYYNNAWSSNREHIVSRANELFESLSAHPHASDCDKRGSESGVMTAARHARQRVDTWSKAKRDFAERATKSEGGVKAGAPVVSSEVLNTAGATRQFVGERHPSDRTADVTTLADAMWQLLDDMGENGQCVCLAAKAQARVAYEAFREDEYADWMPLERAKQVLKDAGT